MAKGIELNGMLRGKRGGVVYSRLYGQQISRARVFEVSNPKTTKQQAQRAIFATTTAAYSKMKAICDHSFEGVQYGAKSQQAFMKENLSIMRQRAAQDDGNFLIPNVSVLMANPYLISKGSLSSPQNIELTLDENNVYFNIGVGGNITVNQFCRALGIDKGDQITIVGIVDVGGAPVGAFKGFEYRNNKFVYCRITVLADAADDAYVYYDGQFGNAVEVEGFDSGDFSLSDYDDIVVSFNRVDSVLAAAVIRSAKVGDKWLRSTEFLTLNSEMMIYPFNDILRAWKEGVTPLEVGGERYLNNAEQENVYTRPDLIERPVRISTSQVISLAVINSGQYAGHVMVDNLNDRHPYLRGEGGWQRSNVTIAADSPVNVITLAKTTLVIGYQPTIITG